MENEGILIMTKNMFDMLVIYSLFHRIHFITKVLYKVISIHFITEVLNKVISYLFVR